MPASLVTTFFEVNAQGAGSPRRPAVRDREPHGVVRISIRTTAHSVSKFRPILASIVMIDPGLAAVGTLPPVISAGPRVLDPREPLTPSCEPMNDDHPSGVLGGLPHTGRTGAVLRERYPAPPVQNRVGSRKTPRRAGSTPVAAHADGAAAPAARRQAGPSRQPRAEPRRAARQAQRRRRPKPAASRRRPAPGAPRPTAEPRRPSAPPPRAPEPSDRPSAVGTAVQAAAELAEIGLTVSARALRGALSRLPRPSRRAPPSLTLGDSSRKNDPHGSKRCTSRAIATV